MSVAEVYTEKESFRFLTWVDSSGYFDNTPQIEEEELRSMGVAGRRWRQIANQQADIYVEAIAEAASHAEAVALAVRLRSVKGQIATSIGVSVAGKTYNKKNVHIAAITAVVRPGAVIGGGASASSAAHVVAMMTLVPTAVA